MGVAELKSTAVTAYAGDVSPAECWRVLQEDAGAFLVDVRTEAEWAEVGYPDLSSLEKELVRLSWRYAPDYTVNNAFVPTLRTLISDKETPVFFLCKVGGRSAEAAAAMQAQGYTQCFNVMYGFEGVPDGQGLRGLKNGWKAEGLPWVRS